MLYLAQPANVTNVIHGYSGEIEFVKVCGVYSSETNLSNLQEKSFNMLL